MEGFPLLAGKWFLINRFNPSKTVVTFCVVIKNLPSFYLRESHFYQLSRLAIAHLVGEVPSVASALPTHESPPTRICSDVACRVAILRCRVAILRYRVAMLGGAASRY